MPKKLPVPKPTGTFYLILVLSLIASLMLIEQFVVPRLNQPQQEVPDNPQGQLVPLRVGSNTVQVEIRDDEAERELGFSGRATIGENEGMLFIFDQPLQPTFWMKDMQFSLDVLWIRDGRVVEIEENVVHPTQAAPVVKTMIPQNPVDMVLEVPSGWVSRMGAKAGDQVSWQ
jgi:uncharacterized membrane protein (UPF0127 family)